VIENLIKKIAQLLDRRNISYMIIGGQAVLLYGRPRLTRDIDLKYVEKWLSEFGKIPEHESISARFNNLLRK
jgi:hypothetical protein